MMPVITLTTDFGTRDEYVGVMKGVILSVLPDTTIVDITHEIPPFSPCEAARMLNTSYRYFPENSVHVVVVDPGVGSSRAIVAFDIHGHKVVAPDNGIPAFLAKHNDVKKLVRVENKEFFLDKISSTFHGRDIFAPVAARLAGKTELNQLGPEMNISTLVDDNICSGPVFGEDGVLRGTIVAIDHFGNLVTDIEKEVLTEAGGGFFQNDIEISFKGHVLQGVSPTYGSVKPGDALALIGSRGSLEIAVSCGNAKEMFDVIKGEPVYIRFGPEKNR